MEESYKFFIPKGEDNMDTVKINSGATAMVAHRGVSKLERENTVSAFIAAGNRSYYGIETDVCRTRDGRYVLLHDGHTERIAVGGVKVCPADVTYEELRAVALTDVDGVGTRSDLYIATLEDYISICKKYGKVAVLELKKAFDEQDIENICNIIDAMDYLGGTHFITFYPEYIGWIRKYRPIQTVSLLLKDYDPAVIDGLVREKVGLDIYYKSLTRELVAELKGKGICLNCWTVDDPERAEELVEWGVDMITTNILE